MPWHPGELKLQIARGYKEQVAGVEFDKEMSARHRQLYPLLQFAPLSCIDSQGRPWAAIITSKDGTAGFIHSPNPNELRIKGRTWPGDPLWEVLGWNAPQPASSEDVTRQDPSKSEQSTSIATTPGLDKFLVAGVGVQYETRRRTKFLGYIKDAKRTGDLDYEFQTVVDEADGACPKYINVRQVIPRESHPRVQYSSWNHDGPLPDEVINFIHEADTIHVASFFRAKPEDELVTPSRAGSNSRGGLPGFTRVMPSDKRTIVMPDFSGNRFMQSLGNIETAGVVGLTMFSWTTGDVLYLTGEATNYVGAPAQEIMPRQNAITTVRVTGLRFVLDALPFGQAPGTEPERSAYSPPIRKLREEVENNTTFVEGTFANLTSIQLHSDTIATMEFELVGDTMEGLSITAGQAVILDFTKLLGSVRYQHMAEQAPVSVNDDRIRTWTISSPHELGIRSRTFKITMREKPNGAVTGTLFRLARQLRETHPSLGSDARSLKIEVGVVGVAGDFALPTREGAQKLLWVAGGIGFTPFIAFLSALVKRPNANVDVIFAFSTREPETLVPLVRKALGDGPLPAALRLRIDIFTSEDVPSVKLFNGFRPQVKVNVVPARISDSYWDSTDATQCEVWVCGPASFEEVVLKGLEKAGLAVGSVHREGFQY